MNHKALPSARRKRRMLGALVRERWPDVVLLALFLTLTGSFRSLGADYIQTITDHIQTDGSRGLGGLIGIACAIQAVNYSTKFLAAYLCMSLTKRLTLQIRLALVRHVQAMPCALYEAHPVGDLQSVMHNDTDVAANYIYVLFSRIGTSVVTALFTFWFMARIDGPITLAVLLVTVCFGAVNRRILQNIRQNERISRKAIGSITETVVNGCETADTIRAYGAQGYWLGWFHRHRSVYNRARINIRVIDRSRMALYTVVNSLTLFGSAIYMAYRALSGAGTLGSVLAYITLLTQALISIEMIFRWMSSLVESDAAWDRVDAVLAEGESEEAEPAPVPDVERLELRHIGYQYPGGPRLFADRDFALEKGHVYAVVGESGLSLIHI